MREIEHHTVEYISTATIVQGSRVWHDEMLHHKQYTGEPSAMLLPMINLDPSYPYSIYTAMQFVSYQAKQNDATLILTFDQTLYWKALTNIQFQTGGSDRDQKRMVISLSSYATEHPLYHWNVMAGLSQQQLLEDITKDYTE